MALEVTIDHTVLAFTLGASVCAAILFGLAPALHGTAVDLHATLKEGGRASSQSKSRNRTHSILVTAEIALRCRSGRCGFFCWIFSAAATGLKSEPGFDGKISLSAHLQKIPRADFFRNHPAVKRFRRHFGGCHNYTGVC
jgi:hypothetical protein